ncbi:hypothetical protein GWI33_021019 [Rhynchophorus ferrugineus]|uniref:Protein AATF n=1 Tax=Rhynchophorus ferrugineus TaxID=354439 RepID=A0A834HNF5_RHYFE|nr:hypothetical protein GWI33_021019 [Rhynchophorus ferrugineus]
MIKKQSKNSLASKIAGLLSAVPEQFNPDDDHVDDTAAKLADFNDDFEGDVSEEILSGFRKQNIDLLGDIDKKYAGKKGSRKTLRYSSSEESDALVIDEEVSGEEESDNSKVEDESENEDLDDNVNSDIEEDQEELQSDEGSEEEQDSLDDDEYGEHSGSEIHSENDGNFQHMNQSNESLQVKKGLSVRNQMNMWENLLEIRIQLQKCLSATNRLPQGDYYKEMIDQSNSDLNFKSKVEETKDSIENVLSKLLTFQNLVMKRYPETKNLNKDNDKKDIELDDNDEEIPSDTDEEMDMNNQSDLEEEEVPLSKKRKLSDYENDISDVHEKYQKYRNTVIEKWNAKTRLSITKNAGQVHSVLNQIDHVLRDKSRLIKRTQLKKSDFNILGEMEEAVLESNENIGDVKQPEVGNTEIFDDSDFYHQLLRELIEAKSAGITDPVQLGRQWIQLQNLRNKMKRKIDTRATKGRKIRYTVHTKLVNFMAPYTQETWTDEAKNELYSSLFGKLKTKPV